MKITQFDRATLRELQPKLKTELSKVGKKFGLDLGIGGITFYDTHFTTKLTVKVNSPSAKRKETQKDKNEFKAYCTAAGINATKANKGTFKIRTVTYQVLGKVNTRSRKYPFLCKNMNTKKIYGITTSTIKRYFSK